MSEGKAVESCQGLAFGMAKRMQRLFLHIHSQGCLFQMLNNGRG